MKGIRVFSKKAIALVVALAVVISSFATGLVFIATANQGGTAIDAWDGSVATSFAGGDGSLANPYQIANAEQLAYLYKTVQTTGSSFSNDKHFKLTADIYLNDVSDSDWKTKSPRSWYASTSTNGYRFTGNFDGDGHTVYGLYYNGSEGNIGLLPIMDNWNYDIYVKDLTISDSYIQTTGNIVGAVSSRLYSGNNKMADFSNICITDSVTVKGTGGTYVAGILGFSNCNDKSFYQFSGCSVLANVSSGKALLGYGTTSTSIKIQQSFTTASKWHDSSSQTGNGIYIISNKDAIKGKAAAMAQMPDLDWGGMWDCTEDGMPFTTNNSHIWTGLIATSYESGAGTKASPYIIKTPEQLAKLVKEPTAETKGKYYKITADIKVNDTSSSDWKATAKPWFTYNSGSEIFAVSFQGTLDGADHTITGLYYDGANDYVGLFPSISYSGTTANVKNLAIDNSYLKSDSCVSAFAAYIYGNVTYDKCKVGENVTLIGKRTAGYAPYGQGNVTISNSYSVASISGTEVAGAFIGDVWSSTLTINDSFGTNILLGKTSRTLNGSKNYSTVADTKGTNIVASIEQMKGTAARVNMPKLEWLQNWKTDPNGGLPLSTTADPEGKVGEEWTGAVATKYAGGTGKKDDPYLIETGEQLAKLVKEPTAETKGKYYKITADIILNDTSFDGWKTIAKDWFTYNSGGEIFPLSFQGTLDGDSHTITGLYYKGTNSYVGLFPSISNSGVTANVKNLTFDNCHLESTGCVSPFAAYIYGNVNYENCKVGENVTLIGKRTAGYAPYGSGNVTINTCLALASVSGTEVAGAFIGDVWSSTLTINNSIGTNIFIGHTGRTLTGSKNYSTVADTFGTYVVTADQMKGADAKTNMPALDWGISWKINPDGGYPLTMIVNPEGTVGGIWSGNEASKYVSGNGKKDNPYIITTGEQLLKMVRDTESDGKYYKLANDIKLNDTSVAAWKEYARSWGCNSNIFKGTFDGDGHTIDGLFYKGLNNKVGLFGLAKDAVIKNVIFTNSHIESQGYATGTVVGDVNSGSVKLEKVYVSNGFVKSTFEADNNKGAGGLIGYGAAKITVKACAYLGQVEAPANAGAILGNCWAKDSKQASDITITQTISNAGIKFCSKQGLSSKSDNNYSTYTADEKYVATIANDSMLGEQAMTNMPALEWKTYWTTTAGYPECYYGDVVRVEEKVWSGEEAATFESGTGTEEDPYIIVNSEQLAKMVLDAESNGKFYKLGNDISLNDTSLKNWTYYARQWVWSSNIFQGTFDGDGHTIDGLYFESTKDKVGLFCYAKNAVIKNVKIINSYVKSTGYATGTVVGDANAGTVELYQVYVSDGYVESTYNADSNKGAGGLIGYGGAKVTVTGSAFFGKVKAPSNAGAILGNCWAKEENQTSALVVTQTISNAGIKFCTKQSLSLRSDANYSTAKTTESGVISIDADKMVGKDAMVNMPALDWGKLWKTTDGNPVCRFGETVDMAENVWSGDVADAYAGGDGTESNPYIINNGEQLAKMVLDTESKGKFYKLGADIKLNDTTIKDWTYYAGQWIWTNNIFEGNIDGAGHTIDGLYFESTKDKVGLFCYAKNASIKNIKFTNSYVKSTGYATGTVVGDANAGTVELYQIYVGDGYVESTYDVDGNKGAGGLIGYGGAKVTITGSAFFGKVKAPGNAGAIIGNCWAKEEKDQTSALVVTQTISNAGIKFCTKQSLSSRSDNNYSSANETETGVITVAADKMTGKNAMANMPALDWGRLWKTTSGNPVCRFGETIEVAKDVWSGEVADAYAGGDGSRINPYIIMNGEQLAKMVLDAENSGKYYKLGADIKLNDTSIDNWTYYAKQWIWTNNIFKGRLDGDCHTISGLYFDSTKSKVGLICYAANANINRVILDSAYVHSSGYAVGTFVGDANSGSVIIKECYVNETSSVVSTYDADNNKGAGGFVGYGGATIEIEGSAYLGTVSAPGYAGAFIGNSWTSSSDKVNWTRALITNSFATPELKFSAKQTLAGDSANNYSPSKAKEPGVNHIELSKMKGSAAQKNMPLLNWVRSWKTSEGFPVLNVGEYEGVKGGVWTGRLAKEFAGGSGTKEDPYLIETPEQLAKLLDDVLDSKGKYYKLTADIYLNDVSKPNWESTANEWFWVSTARYGNFNGNFNGDGHVIYGMYLNLEPQNTVIYTGLFPTISDGTVVEKVGFSNCHVKVANDNVDIQSYVGAIAGVVFLNQSEAESDPNNLPRISQCFGDSKTILEGRYVGGLIGGGAYTANIDNSYFIGEVIGERVGAIVGNTWTDYVGATIKQSYSATNAVDIFSGGRAGVQNSSSPINYKDNYSNATGLASFVSQISVLMMRGEAAKKNMPALDFDKIWYALENGTPVLRIFGKSDKFSNTKDPEPIKVSFVTNGGTDCPTAYGNPEEKLDLPTPKREGYKFEGWYVYKELDIPFTIDYFPYFDTILYAKWSPLGIIQDFEDYENSPYDYGSDYEYYRPGTVGYNAAYVKSGMASMHRKGETKDDADFLINYMDTLVVGKKYKMTFFVTTDKEGTKVDLSLVHEDFPDVFDSDSGVESIKTLKKMKAGEWQEVEVTFTAKTKWLAIRTSGNASVFFEDVMVLPTDSLIPGSSSNVMSGVLLYVVIGLAVLVIAGAGVGTAIVIKKRKNKI